MSLEMEASARLIASIILCFLMLIVLLQIAALLAALGFYSCDCFLRGDSRRSSEPLFLVRLESVCSIRLLRFSCMRRGDSLRPTHRLFASSNFFRIILQTTCSVSLVSRVSLKPGLKKSVSAWCFYKFHCLSFLLRSFSTALRFMAGSSLMNS